MTISDACMNFESGSLMHMSEHVSFYEYESKIICFLSISSFQLVHQVSPSGFCMPVLHRLEEKEVFKLLKCSHRDVLFQNADTCPVYPTEVVFALDMSEGVTPAAFERMRNIVMSLLKAIKISESNCPTGARVSIVSFNTNTRYLIRFSEFQKHNLLLQAVQSIPLERSTGKRNIGAAMRFVARNVFKRVRQGILTRKVAVFFANGPSQEDVVISTAVLELSAWDITPVVIAFTELPNVRRAFSVSRP